MAGRLEQASKQSKHNVLFSQKEEPFGGGEKVWHGLEEVGHMRSGPGGEPSPPSRGLRDVLQMQRKSVPARVSLPDNLRRSG